MFAIRKYIGGDRIIWAVIIVLSLYSLLSVYSTSGILVFRNPGSSPTYYVFRHGLLLMAGLFMVYLTHLIPYRYFSRLSQILVIIVIPLLIATLIIGEDVNQASRRLAVFGFTFQTSDLAKLALIMYVARMLSQKQNEIRDLKKAFLPMIIPVGIICVLIMTEDLSTALILMATCVILMFIGRIKKRYLALAFLAGIIVIVSYIGIVVLTHNETSVPANNETSVPADNETRVPTWKKRWRAFIHKESEPYQVEQAKIAIASGGFLGKFPGNSTQRNFLPHSYSDYIYAVIVEEYGLILGGIPILLLYLILLYRAGVLVRKSTRTFQAFLAVGLTLGLILQAMVHMAVAVNLLPVTGQPLPLVSMGGTSRIITCISLGIILSVSKGIIEQQRLESETATK